MRQKEETILLFDIEEPWEKEWQGMPEFSQRDRTPWKSIAVNFMSPGDMQSFAELVGPKVTATTASITYPPRIVG